MLESSLEVFFLLFLLVLNGVFAMAELALVSSRKAKLQSLAEEGDRKAQRVLDQTAASGKYLGVVQVAITLIGVLSGAVGGATIAERLERYFVTVPGLELYAEVISLTLVVIPLTFLSVVLGELVPKRLGLLAPEKTAMGLGGLLEWMARLFAPVVWLLEKSSDVMLRALGVKATAEPVISEDEVRVLIDQGASAGVFKPTEAQMVEGVLDLDEETVGSIMTPRARLVWLDAEAKEEENWRRVAGSGHSHFPVFHGRQDNVLGMVSVKALWANLSLAGKVDLRTLVTPPLYVPASMPAMKLIEEFKRSGKHIALVMDEFGSVNGLVTLHDVLENIVGKLPEKGATSREPQARPLDDGTWMVDALLEVEVARAALEIEDPWPGEEEHRFRTIGGFVLHLLGHLPKEGEHVFWDGWRFEVIDMDRQRIDKILVRPPPKPAPAPVDEEADEKE